MRSNHMLKPLRGALRVKPAAKALRSALALVLVLVMAVPALAPTGSVVSAPSAQAQSLTLASANGVSQRGTTFLQLNTQITTNGTLNSARVVVDNPNRFPVSGATLTVGGRTYTSDQSGSNSNGVVTLTFSGLSQAVTAGTSVSTRVTVVGGTATNWGLSLQAFGSQPQQPPKTWNGSDANGQYSMTATQGANSSKVTFTRTLDQDGTLTGPIRVWASNKNGYDVDGGAPSELKIIGPDGQVVYSQSGAPYSNNVLPYQNWAGVEFKLPKDLELKAGTRIEVTSPYAKRATSVDSSILSPFGAGGFTFGFQQASNYQYPNQKTTVCNRLAGRGPVTGFRIAPNSFTPREIHDVTRVAILDMTTGQVTYPNSALDVSLTPTDGPYNAYVKLANPLEIGENQALCAFVTFSADKLIQDNPGYNFTLAGERNLYPGESPRIYENTLIEPFSDWDKPQVENPAPALKCGQNIAIVLDASNSVIRKDGVDATTDSAKNIVQALSGTATTVGIYNFGSRGTRFQDAKLEGASLQDAEGTRNALGALENYRQRMNDPAAIRSLGQGATNWEAALENIEAYNKLNSSKKYDVVYFITDGNPTITDTTPTGGGDDYTAGMVHVSDFYHARNVADRVKTQGTRIQPVLVNIPRNFKEPVAKDSTADYKNLDRYLQMYGKAPAHTFSLWGSDEAGASFVRDELNLGNMDVSIVDESTIYGEGFGDVLAADRSPEPQPEPNLFRKQLDQRDWSTWAATELTPLQAGDIIASQGDSILAETFDDLRKVLADVALADCAGSVSLLKDIADPDGKVLRDADLDGWKFTASTEGRYLQDAAGALTNTVSGTTDEHGSVSFKFSTNDPAIRPAITIREEERDGYRLFQQGGNNAVCTVNYTDGRPSERVLVENLSTTGFEIKVSPESIVTCRVVNQIVPEDGFFRVIKVDEEGASLDGSSFEVWRADATGTAPAGDAPVWKTGNEQNVRLERGKYVLIETRSPAGYSLLPAPIPFEISLDENFQQRIEFGKENSTAFVVESGSEKPESKPLGHYVTVANVTKGELPKTGGSGVGLIALLGAALAGLGVLFARRSSRA